MALIWLSLQMCNNDKEKNESAGAGEEGTDELLKNYLKATPYAKIVDSPHNKLYSFSEFLKMQNEFEDE